MVILDAADADLLAEVIQRGWGWPLVARFYPYANHNLITDPGLVRVFQDNTGGY